MSRQILIAQAKGNIQYQFYSTSMLYPAYYNNYRGSEIIKNVKLSVYGIVAIIFIGQEQIHYDSGPLNTRNYKVSALFHHLCRQDIQEVEEIRRIIWSEYSDWCKNSYGNPFSQKANQLLRRDLSIKKFRLKSDNEVSKNNER
ncbi:hypothetical protein [Paenibacillus sabinae]|uniref:Uncharacterized protein n=1 Tax=Paenibacillus sabinae T27 TaxID=1268072 RepID=X4ZBR5_9BACL|nr:hypothetical protein [Paenibacillus sabinae]AHV97066.1 hypothetical protein PSAB_10680 [Paenibacillus sabinae T27]